MSILMAPVYSLSVNGQDLAEFGVYTSGEKTFDSDEKDFEFVSIPGRSGDLIRPNKRKKNSTVTYSCFIAENFNANVMALRNFLETLPETYVRIDDNRHPDEYRMGVHTGTVTFNVFGSAGNYEGATFDLQFNVKPYRYLLSGERTVQLTGNGSITNPTNFTSKPLLQVFGNGSVTVNGNDGKVYTATISNNNNKNIYLDCETQNAYSLSGSGQAQSITYRNSDVVLSDHLYPVLTRGTVNIQLTGVTKVIITPRWYRA